MKYASLILVLLLLAAVGCASSPLENAVTLDLTDVKPDVGYKELANVLDRVVGNDGYVYLELMCRRTATTDKPASQPATQPTHAKSIDDVYTPGACRLRRQLDKQVKRMAVAGPTATPELFPTPADRLTYWYNARCTWVLRLLVAAWDQHEDAAAHPNTPQPPAIAYAQRRFQIDGGVMTLEGIDAAIARQGGPLAVMVAPGLDLRRATLPQKPFNAETVFETLPERLNKFVADEKRFIVDIMNQRVLIPPVIWQYRDALLARHRKDYDAPQATLTTALLPLVSGAAERRLQNALGYTSVRNNQPRYAIVQAD